MVFQIKRRAHRTEKDVAGINMTQHRIQIAKAVEQASIIPYPLYLSGAQTASSTTPIGITPVLGCKADSVRVHIGTQGTGAVTLDVRVDGTSILTAPIDLDVDTNTAAVSGAVLTGTLTAAAKAALAAGKRITVVVVGAASGAADLTVDFHAKTVDNTLA